MLSSTCCWHASRCGSSCLRAFWGTVGCNLGRCCWPWLAPLEKTPPGVVICAGCRQNGAPLTDKSMYKLVWTTAFRITGKKLNPHLIRDSVVTHLRGSGASERELEVGGWAGWLFGWRERRGGTGLGRQGHADVWQFGRMPMFLLIIYPAC